MVKPNQPVFYTSQLLVYESGSPDPGAVTAQLGRNITTDPDVIILTDEKSIKIEHVRQLQSQMSTRPLTQAGRLVVICPAEKITRPAQQALLKLIEEPPPNTQIVLATQAKQSVLPTIASRCAIKYVRDLDLSGSSLDSANEPSLIEQILDLENNRQKVEFIQSLPNKREELVEMLLIELRRPLTLTRDTKKALRLKHGLLDVLEALQGNVNPSLCLEKWIL